MIVKTEAIILKSDNYRDSSKIITAYTKDYGKIRCIAKGVRDVKTKWGGVLQAMSYLNILMYYNETRTLHLLTNAEYVRAFQSLSSDYDKLQAGFRIIEVLNKLTGENYPNPEIFSITGNSLSKLDEAKAGYLNILYDFQFQVLRCLGFEIENKSIENILNNSKPGSYYYNSPNSDIMVKETPGRNPVLKILETICSGNFKLIMELNITEELHRNIDRFFEYFYQLHFENLQNFKSNKVFQAVKG